MKQADRRERRFARIVFNRADDAADDFHLHINTSRTPSDCALASIEALQAAHAIQRKLQQEAAESRAHYTMDEFPELKNESEKEFAHLLNMYGIDWRYEPKTFPVEWDSEGRVTLAFSPDFYLPRFNLYLELTTMNQRYVTMKNKKARKVQELYPGTNVRIVYRKDFLSMLERFDT